MMNQMLLCCVLSVLDGSAVEHVYLRPADDGWEVESRIELHGNERLVSTTYHKGLELRLDVSYRNSSGIIGELKVETVQKGELRSARVTWDRTQAKIVRSDGTEAYLDCAPGAITTSAPDWTDAFLLVRRHTQLVKERPKEFEGKPCEFQALWIHPTQAPQVLMLKIEPKGEVEVKRNGKPHVLLRYEIVLRGGSRYPVWGTPDGLLVRLVPAVAKEPRRAGIVLRGWEDVVELLHNG